MSEFRFGRNMNSPRPADFSTHCRFKELVEMHYSELAGRRAVLIAGPTAGGKSTLACEIADALGGIVVNSDSMQVYSCWQVLTARPSQNEMCGIPHELYGHIDFDAPYSVGSWLEEMQKLLLEHADRPLIIVGGTGLYFSALTSGLSPIPSVPDESRSKSEEIFRGEGIEALLADLEKTDPDSFNSIDKANPARVMRAWEVLHATGRGIHSWQSVKSEPLLPLGETHPIMVHLERERLARRIEDRVRLMARGGALSECQAMIDRWDPSLPSSRAIGAKEFVGFLQGERSLDDAIDQTMISTRQYAKRQMTWFKGRMKNWNWVGAAELRRIRR